MEQTLTLRIWESESDRNMGEAFTREVESNTLEGAINEAKNLYYRHDYAAVEVEDENEMCLFHISTDVPDGEYHNTILTN